MELLETTSHLIDQPTTAYASVRGSQQANLTRLLAFDALM